MEFSASDIAQLLNGKIVGNPEIKVTDLAKIEEGKTGTVCFLGNSKYVPFLQTTKASLVIISEEFVPNQEVEPSLVIVPDAQAAFARLLKHYNPVDYNKKGIETPSFLSKTSKIGSDVYIGAFTYLGENVVIGNNVKLFPNCYIGDNVTIDDNTIVMTGTRIYAMCKVGKNCFIHANTVIGSDGFGFSPSGENGKLEKIPQIGNVVIEDDVEIGAACTIDRATLGSTRIKSGAKLDNQIQIAHNVEVGSHTVIASQAGIAGSTKIGVGTQIGGQAGLAGHLKIGNQVRIQAQSGLNRNAEDKSDWYGSPGIKYNDYRRSYVYFKKFPEIVNKLNELEKAIKKLSTRK